MTQGKTEVQLELTLDTEDEMLQDAITSINGMSDKGFEQELVEAGFQLAPTHMQDGETQLHNVVLDNDNLKSIITAMESYMSECGVLIGWKDNKDKYL